MPAVLFTSGSTIRGLVGLAGAEYLEAVLAMPAICIGPETAQEARRHGYAVVAEAPMQATETLAETAARVVSGRARATP